MAEGETLADLGEWELIRRLGAFAPAGQFDDDAAIVESSSAEYRAPATDALIVSTDVLVEDVHFAAATTGPADVGWRAAAANLSDLAAMGCRQVIGLTVGLVAPPPTPWSWVEGVYGGIRSALEAHGGILLGGDCSRGRQRLLAITALGRLGGAGAGPVRRRDGRAGDRLICSGVHGLSRLGLELLLCSGNGPHETAKGPPLPAPLRERAIRTHRRPRPRFDAVDALIASRPAGLPWRVAGCDSSDGLAAAVGTIAAASGCAARLERQRLPLDPDMAALPEAESWCLGGGEDFELVLALEPAWAEALLRRLPGSREIGALTGDADPGTLWWKEDQSPITAGGYSHFG